MKIDLLKKVIKEAVKEAIQEEFKETFTEFKHNKINTVNKSLNPTKLSKESGPISEMINMTKNSMESEDYRNILNFNTSDMSSLYSKINDNIPIEQTFSSTQPGLDISNLNFVKNASKVFKASIEKDRQKNGF